MVEVLLRPGVYREVVAGAAWTLLRLRGRCMGVRELYRELRRLGLDAGLGKLQDALQRYTGRLFQKTRVDGRTLYCALEKV